MGAAIAAAMEVEKLEISLVSAPLLIHEAVCTHEHIKVAGQKRQILVIICVIVNII